MDDETFWAGLANSATNNPTNHEIARHELASEEGAHTRAATCAATGPIFQARDSNKRDERLQTVQSLHSSQWIEPLSDTTVQEDFYHGTISETMSTEHIECWLHGCNGRVFASLSNYRRHCRERTNLADRPTCSICRRTFTRKSARDQHQHQRRCETIDFDGNGIPFKRLVFDDRRQATAG